MHRRGIRVVAIVFLLTLSVAVPARADSRQVFAHVFTVPTDLPGGGDITKVLPPFESWLVESFGGYTRLGPGDGAWKNEAGEVEAQGNTVYLVTADRDAGKDIAGRLTKDFGERVPYVLVFPAGLFVK